MNRRRVNPTAFTLIEVLLVLVILTILAAVIVPQIAPQSGKARLAAARSDISSLESALNTFQVNCGRFPSDAEGLAVLVQNPGAAGWAGPYVKLIPHDPWGDSYIYQAPGEHFPDSFDLHSAGPDKQDGNDDDVTNWQG